MEKIDEIPKIINRRGILNKKITISFSAASLLKSFLAVALFLIVITVLVYAGDVIVESGKLDVSSNLIVDASGNVGIGTTIPAYKLDVNGVLRLQPTSAPATPANGNMYYDTTTNKFRCYENSAWKDCDTTGGGGGSGGWTDGGTNVYLTTTTDNVGIGTTGPANKLVVAADAVPAGNYDTVGQLAVRGSTNGNNVVIVGYDTTNNYGWIQPSTDGVAWRNLALNPGGGNVGIGTTTPAYKLDVNGVVNAACPSGMTDAGAFCIETSERAALNWYNAVDTCGGIGRKVCRMSEWYYACSNFALNQETNNEEWTSDRSENNAYVIGNGGCKASSRYDPDINTRSFRCCIDKKLSST